MVVERCWGCFRTAARLRGEKKKKKGLQSNFLHIFIINLTRSVSFRKILYSFFATPPVW